MNGARDEASLACDSIDDIVDAKRAHEIGLPLGF